MTQGPSQPPIPPDDARGPNPGESGIISGSFRHQQLSARVPESVAAGVFSTGAIVVSNNTELVVDFLIRMVRPYQVVSRVILPPVVVPGVARAVREGLSRWSQLYGPVPTLPKPEAGPKPSIQEVYEDLKLPDERLSGVYANSLMMSFSAAEFAFDFIANFFPRSVVSARVYMAVPQVPRFVDALEQTYQDYIKRATGQQGHAPPPPPPPLSAGPADPGNPDAGPI